MRIYAIAVTVILLAFVVWHFRQQKPTAASTVTATASTAPVPPAESSKLVSTNVYAHNLRLRKGPKFSIYIPWLRGEMARAHRNVNPSFDDPESFFLDIKNGVLRANIGDIANYLNSGRAGNSPLQNISLSGDGDQIKLTGTIRKLIPLPIELRGTLSAVSGNRIRVHVTKLGVLKIPMKGLLGVFHVSVADLFNSSSIRGIDVTGNDIFFDTQVLLPPPHIRGKLTAVRVANPDLEEVYGDAQQDIARTEQWRNFLRLHNGTIDFGKLTMHHVDLIMIDTSKDAWFDLDLTNYQEQLVNGYTRMTPTAGLQIFMPDLDEIPHNKKTENISMEWMKHRNMPPPSDVTPSQKQ